MFKYPITILLCIFCTNLFSQRLTLRDAEVALQKNNLLLLAEHYNISAAQAGVIQAKIWEQPFLSAEINAVNPEGNKKFDAGRQGQKALAIQQLIYLGGKKKQEVEYAVSNVELAKIQFEQLLRSLKYELEQSFYSLYFNTLRLQALDEHLGKVDTLKSAYEIQSAKGNLPLKEVVRLQALVLNLKNEQTDLIKNALSYQQSIKLLTGINNDIEPMIDEDQLLASIQNINISLDSLQSLALQYNLEIKQAAKILKSQQINVRWQKSLAKPDLTAGLSYDQRGGAFQNQVNLTLGLPLPLWNRNKGNIQAAENQVHQKMAQAEYQKRDVSILIVSAYQVWLTQLGQYQSIPPLVHENMKQVYQGVMVNFQKRNIALLEFTDFMESYNQTLSQITEIKKNLILAGLTLNYITNAKLF